MKFCLKKYSGHPRCRWVWFFIWTYLKKFSVMHLPTILLQWMGAVIMRVKNMTVIHKAPVDKWIKLISSELKSLVFVITFQLKLFSKYNMAFSSEIVVSSESGEKYAQIKHYLQVKTFQNSKQICWTNIFPRQIGTKLVFWPEALTQKKDFCSLFNFIN